MITFKSSLLATTAAYSLLTSLLPAHKAFAATAPKDAQAAAAILIPADRLPAAIENPEGSLEPGKPALLSIQIIGAERAEVLRLINPPLASGLPAVTNVTFSSPTFSNNHTQIRFITWGAAHTVIDKGAIIYTDDGLPLAMTFSQVNGVASEKFFALRNTASVKTQHLVTSNTLSGVFATDRSQDQILTGDEQLKLLQAVSGSQANASIVVSNVSLHQKSKTIVCDVASHHSSLSVPVDIRVGKSEIWVRFCGRDNLKEGSLHAENLSKIINNIVSEKSPRFALVSSQGAGYILSRDGSGAIERLTRVTADKKATDIPLMIHSSTTRDGFVTYQCTIDLGNGGVKTLIATVSTNDATKGMLRIFDKNSK